MPRATKKTKVNNQINLLDEDGEFITQDDINNNQPDLEEPESPQPVKKTKSTKSVKPSSKLVVITDEVEKEEREKLARKEAKRLAREAKELEYEKRITEKLEARLNETFAKLAKQTEQHEKDLTAAALKKEKQLLDTSNDRKGMISRLMNL